MNAAGRYTYEVAFSPEDEAYVSRVLEWPSLAAHGGTAEVALAELRSVVAGVLEELARAGESAPVPLAEQRCSGHFALRMPPELHRALAREAQRQAVSLNQLIATRLARSLSR
ncbi:MAG: hypothetical protein A2138_15015 [Deltaproteobacteria bacterium RBG_16_71_12]|nr:MAG: hypothetical protein A2138_15015 [Deltaproteobacteria bacterium RBG_16_71_12]